MKKQIITFAFTIIFTLFAYNGFSQGPPPPPGTGHGQTGNQNGGSAPVGGGMFILLALGSAYGGKKLYHLFDDNEDDMES